MIRTKVDVHLCVENNREYASIVNAIQINGVLFREIKKINFLKLKYTLSVALCCFNVCIARGVPGSRRAAGGAHAEHWRGSVGQLKSRGPDAHQERDPSALRELPHALQWLVLHFSSHPTANGVV